MTQEYLPKELAKLVAMYPGNEHDEELNEKILRTALIKHFPSFLHKVFNTLHPRTNYVDNWHLKLICQYLQSIDKGDIKRLIINLPPRSLKSICINVAWPAWLLGHNPSSKIISISYSKALSIKHAQDCRKIMQQPWYQDLFPSTVINTGDNAKDKFVTTEHGFRFSTSIGSTLTGEGADLIIIDDPQTPAQARSENTRDKLYEWMCQTLFSRLNDWDTGKILLVMQRVNKDDLTGKLLKYNPDLWKHLTLPAIAEEDTKIKFGSFNYHRPKGEVLTPQLSENIKQIEKELGSFAFAAQYQQKALCNDSTLMQRKWLHYYDVNATPEFDNVYQSWDCAIKTGEKNDYTVCTTWGEINNQYYLLEVSRQKLAYPYLKSAIHAASERFSPQAILIEDKASGQQLIQELKTELPIIPINPKGDKVTRFLTSSPFFESGKVLLPSKAAWLESLEQELLSFPNAAHDDQVDAISQFIHWIATKNRLNKKPNIRIL